MAPTTTRFRKRQVIRKPATRTLLGPVVSWIADQDSALPRVEGCPPREESARCLSTAFHSTTSMMTVARTAIPRTAKVHSSGPGKRTEKETAISEITMSRMMMRISLLFMPESNHAISAVV